jgi:hypothetical protein
VVAVVADSKMPAPKAAYRIVVVVVIIVVVVVVIVVVQTLTIV